MTSLARKVTPEVAHALPLGVFLLLNAIPGAVAVDNPMLPWWRHSPEHWVYPLQTVVVGALLWLLRGHYTFRPVRGLGLAVLLGAVGIVLWLVPAWIYQDLTARGTVVPEWLEWFGLAERKDGFDPDVFAGQDWAWAGAVAMRFVRMVVVVAFIEEIFWRGFLMRFLQADGGDFRKVPFGRHRWLSFVVVTGCFMVVHHQTDWVGALVFGSLMYWLAIKTKSLAACVVMHAVANLLLGIYIMVTRQWGFW